MILSCHKRSAAKAQENAIQKLTPCVNAFAISLRNGIPFLSEFPNSLRNGISFLSAFANSLRNEIPFHSNFPIH